MIEVKLPKVREDINESLVVIWFVSEGDTVEKGDPLLEIQTEKEVSEIEAEVSGTIKEIIYERGESAKVGEVLATINPAGNTQETKPEEQELVENVEPETRIPEVEKKPEEQKMTEKAETQNKAAEKTEPAKPIVIIPPDLIQTSTASLSAIGDVLIHERLYLDARTATGYDFNPMFAEIKPFLEKADITIANSESIIGGSELGLSTYPAFNSPFEIADAMKNAGIDAVSMANNHTLDKGEQAVINAVEYWDQIGIMHAGAHASEEARRTIPTITKNGIRFSFLSYTYGTNGKPVPAGKEYLVHRIDKPAMKAALVQAKAVSDIVVLSLHFGNEYETMPAAEQKELAHFAAEQGADLIVGHHPHVLQPAEWIETADGRKSFVLYSLGNFLSGQEGLQTQTGGILHIQAVKTAIGSSTAVALQKPSFTPTYVKSANQKNYQVTLLKNENPAANQAVKKHMATWVDDLAFDE